MTKTVTFGKHSHFSFGQLAMIVSSNEWMENLNVEENNVDNSVGGSLPLNQYPECCGKHYDVEDDEK